MLTDHSEGLVASPGLRPFVDQLLESIAAVVGADRATLCRIEGDTVIVEGSFDAVGVAAEPGRPWPITSEDVRALIEERKPLLRDLKPATLPSPFREQLAGTRQMVMVPLLFEGTVVATVTVSRRRRKRFREADLDTLRELGKVAVTALRNAVRLAEAEAVAEELRTSEERFRLLVEGVRDYAIFMLDPEGHVTSWNQGAERIKGYSEDEIIGRHFSTFYPPEDVAGGKPARALATAQNEGRYLEEGWRMRKDGSRFLASVTITALHDEAGRLRGFAKVTRDITERQRIQDQLLEAERREAEKFRELAERMQRLEEMKSALLNLASHELRTPVSLMRGYISLLEEGSLGDLNENGRQAVTVLRRQAVGLNVLVGQMLEAARLEAGSVQLRRQEVDLRVPAAEAVEWARELAGAEHQLRLAIPDRPVRVVADAEGLRTILHNLLDNAIKYSPEGGPVVCEVLEESGHGRVRVTDFGLGIDVSHLDQLFSRFGRVVDRDNAAIPGAGLGLYEARELARLQGGDIGAESSPGRGSTFVFSLPLARAASVNGES